MHAQLFFVPVIKHAQLNKARWNCSIFTDIKKNGDSRMITGGDKEINGFRSTGATDQ
jgi:hypothetical protein